MLNIHIAISSRVTMTKLAGLRLFEMQKKGDWTDMTFNVQGTEIKAHRIVFISCGGVLRQLIESKENDVEIMNITPELFLLVLE